MSINRRGVIASIAYSSVWAALPRSLKSAPLEALEFLVIGDWGRRGTNHQREVAVQMGRAAESRSSQCVLSVGDNFYDDGVQSTADPQWRSSFEDIYSARSLQVPWYVALGNHDYRGEPQAQIDYSKTSTRWRMPSRYYKLAGSDIGLPHLDIFVIDTSPLVNQYRDNVHSEIAKNVASQDVPLQLRWLDDQLNDSTAAWKLVVGHHTIHSGGSGHGDTPEARELIEPLLQKHRVQAYINGHDHDLQHIRRGGVDYVCCGAGSEARPVRAVDGTLFCAARSGFAAIRSAPDSLTLEFRDLAGAVLYISTIPLGGVALGSQA